LGESLGLSPSPQLGQYYMVPFENKVKDASGKPVYKKDAGGQLLKETGRDGKEYPIPETEKHAVFVLGYKGYLQMAIRSGMYRKIIVAPIKEGELAEYNRITEEISLRPITDDIKHEAAKTTGYYAKIMLTGGFEKEMYWSIEKMQIHADRYSAAYSMATDAKIKAGQVPKSDLWKYSSFWYRDFDAMAQKTLLRQIISKWGVMSQELGDAYARDGAAIQQDGTYEPAEIGLADGDAMPGAPEAEPAKADADKPAENGAAASGGGGEELTFDDI
jgi:recombination protein RecT